LNGEKGKTESLREIMPRILDFIDRELAKETKS
jgi:hypothetical protein